MYKIHSPGARDASAFRAPLVILVLNMWRRWWPFVAFRILTRSLNLRKHQQRKNKKKHTKLETHPRLEPLTHIFSFPCLDPQPYCCRRCTLPVVYFVDYNLYITNWYKKKEKGKKNQNGPELWHPFSSSSICTHTQFYRNIQYIKIIVEKNYTQSLIHGLECSVKRERTMEKRWRLSTLSG